MGEFDKFRYNTKEASEFDKFRYDDQADQVDQNIPTEAPDVSKVESFLRGMAQGGTMDFADEITGGAEALYDVATTDKEMGDFVDVYKQRRDESRLEYDKAREANPWTSTAGALTGGMGAMAIPGVGAAGAGLKGAVGMGMGYGLGASEADLTEGEIGEAAKDIGIGGATGGIAHGALKFAGNRVRAAFHRKKARDFIAKSSKQALKASKIKASALDKARTQAGITSKELGDTLADRGIIKFTANPEKMLTRTKEEMQKVGMQMDDLAVRAESSGQEGVRAYDILEGLEAAKIDLISGKSMGKINSKAVTNFFDGLGDEYAAFGDDVISLPRMRELRTNLSEQINNFSKEVGSQGGLNKARRVFTDIMKKKYDEVGLGKNFSRLDKEYSKLKVLEKTFLKGKDTQDVGGGTLFGNIMAGTGGTIVGGAMFGSGGSAVGLGAGILAYSALRKHAGQLMSAGNKTAANSFLRLSRVVDKLPKQQQKAIQKALKKGVSSVLAVDYMLQQSSPKYQKMMRDKK